MKKLFYRLSGSRSFVRLFWMLAVAMLGFAVATEAQAGWGTGSSFWGGSNFESVIKLGDYNVNIVTPSICGPDFVDTLADSNTQQRQRTDCTLIENGVETPAQCEFNDLQCSCFAVGTCKGGTRTSTMTCPTLDPSKTNNLAGCRGQITVYNLDGSLLAHVPNPIPVGNGLDTLVNNGQCGQVFPNDSGLKKSVMGTLKQECTTDLVLEEKVRSTTTTSNSASFFSTTQWFNAVQEGVTCNPSNGFPTNACTNDGGAWITFPLATGDQCKASNFSCGQLAGTDQPIFGPAPSTCTIDKSSGNCQCRCDRCTPEGTLVNLGTGDQGLFVLSSSDNAYACQVTVTGN